MESIVKINAEEALDRLLLCRNELSSHLAGPLFLAMKVFLSLDGQVKHGCTCWLNCSNHSNHS